MTGADIMVKCLEELEVDTLFGYPGVAITPFYNSLTSSGAIHPVLIRAEQNAAHAANGYARISGKPGVCVVTSGPGATNIITGVATAFADSIPMVIITGQVKSDLIGSDVFQEADITGAVESFVKYSYLVKDRNELMGVFKEAFYIASTGRKGPVLIDVPIDIQEAEVGEFVFDREPVKLRTYKPTVKGNSVQIKKVVEELSNCRQPIICVGGGVHLSGAIESVREFCEKYNIPVVTTMMGIGVMPSNHHLFFGMVGNNGRPYANKAMNKADLILMVGCRVADRAIRQPDLITENKILVHIDVDPAEIGKNAGAHVPLVGDIDHIFKEMLSIEETPSVTFEDWVETMEVYRRGMDKPFVPGEHFVDPGKFITYLSGKLAPDSVYVADVGENQMWACRFVEIKSGRFLTSGGMGTMSYAIPAAMGAKIADPEKTVVASCGDGSFQMSMMELATIMQENVGVKIVVFRNNVLGMVRVYQKSTYKGNYTMIDVSGKPILSKIADAYEIPYLYLDDENEMENVVERFLADDSTMLLEVMVDPETGV